jgi:hypothetical protein
LKILEENLEMLESGRNAMLVEAEDVSNAVAWLCCNDAGYVTGGQLPADAGFMIL